LVLPVAQTAKLLKKPSNISLLSAPLPLPVGEKYPSMPISPRVPITPLEKFCTFGRRVTHGKKEE